MVPPDQRSQVNYWELETEQRNPRTMELDRLSTEEILRAINLEDRAVPDAVAAEIPNISRAVEAMVRSLRSGGRVVYIGAGTSGRIGLLDALEWPPTFGVEPEVVPVIIAGGVQATIGSAGPSEDDGASGASELARLDAGPNDAVVAIAASGVTPFVLGAVGEAIRRGCTVVGLCNAPGSPLARLADIPIAPATGPEVLTGSTRMKAGTAQKMVLNMLSTTVMVRLGKVYSNLMVDMSPSNNKLAARAQRMVAQATGLDSEAAGRLLDQAGGSAKVAIVMALAAVERGEAERLLDRAGGFVREAIEAAGEGTSREGAGDA
ncbi:MAG: N-acetylmuramic acid 6-phosphate etherase [Armatimonadetes bacterium]|nr:N-acetylmuramic acid 6-phosphate etherase [Armatimonadota bacterium]